MFLGPVSSWMLNVGDLYLFRQRLIVCAASAHRLLSWKAFGVALAGQWVFDSISKIALYSLQESLCLQKRVEAEVFVQKIRVVVPLTAVAITTFLAYRVHKVSSSFVLNMAILSLHLAAMKVFSFGFTDFPIKKLPSETELKDLASSLKEWVPLRNEEGRQLLLTTLQEAKDSLAQVYSQRDQLSWENVKIKMVDLRGLFLKDMKSFKKSFQQIISRASSNLSKEQFGEILDRVIKNIKYGEKALGERISKDDGVAFRKAKEKIGEKEVLSRGLIYVNIENALEGLFFSVKQIGQLKEGEGPAAFLTSEKIASAVFFVALVALRLGNRSPIVINSVIYPLAAISKVVAMRYFFSRLPVESESLNASISS